MFSLLLILAQVAIVGIIPLILGIVNGRDIPPVDDSKLQLEGINIPEEENAFFDLNYDAQAFQTLIKLNKLPEDKQLVSDYLKSDEWSQDVVEQVLIENEKALEDWTQAAAKGSFQLPYTDNISKISRDIPVTPFNIYRDISRLSGIKAIWLAKDGKYQEALDEALKSIIVGNSIENSQGPLIAYLVGISIKDNGLDVLQKVITIIPQDFQIPSKYLSELEKYRAEKNSSPFIIEYMAWKEGLDKSTFSSNPDLTKLEKMLMKNRFYYKENLTISYYFNFYNNLVIESEKNCENIEKVEWPIVKLERDNLLRMYFTENSVGKFFTYFPEEAFNNVLERKCATENKLQETMLMIINRE
jgi:hypothetical protein